MRTEHITNFVNFDRLYGGGDNQFGFDLVNRNNRVQFKENAQGFRTLKDNFNMGFELKLKEGHRFQNENLYVRVWIDLEFNELFRDGFYFKIKPGDFDLNGWSDNKYYDKDIADFKKELSDYIAKCDRFEVRLEESITETYTSKEVLQERQEKSFYPKVIEGNENSTILNCGSLFIRENMAVNLVEMYELHDNRSQLDVSLDWVHFKNNGRSDLTFLEDPIKLDYRDIHGNPIDHNSMSAAGTFTLTFSDKYHPLKELEGFEYTVTQEYYINARYEVAIGQFYFSVCPNMNNGTKMSFPDLGGTIDGDKLAELGKTALSAIAGISDFGVRVSIKNKPLSTSSKD